MLTQPDLDSILNRGEPPSNWTSRHQFGSTSTHLGPLHAPSMNGIWYNGYQHYVVFYTYPDYWTILDPLTDNYIPDRNTIANVTRAISNTYQHHHEQCPPLSCYRRVRRIAIQNDAPLPPWSCGTIAILTLLHLTLGNIRPNRIDTNNITRQQMLTLHQAILHWLIIGTPPTYGAYNA